MNLRKWVTAVAALSIIGGCAEKKSDNLFHVKGKLNGSKTEKIYLEEIPLATMQNKVVDSAMIKGDGSFSLSASRDRDMIYTVRIGKNPYPSFAVVNDTNQVDIKADYSATGNGFAEKYEIFNSPASSRLKNFSADFGKNINEIFKLDRQSDSLSRLNPADESAINDITSKRKQAAQDLKNLTLASIDNAGNPALAVYMLGYYQTISNQNSYYRLEMIDYDEVYNVVSAVVKKFPHNNEVVKLKEDIEINKKQMEDQQKMMQEQEAQEKKLIGMQAPEIQMPDPAGNNISLSSFKGKYVLVDFWASWCGPCRMENPNVVAAFQKYKNKNFTILGVSLDRDKSKWVQAIMKDNLIWKHISDLKEWESPVVKLYNINGIPYNVLLNPQGKIIAQNLRGSMLEQKLEEVLN